MYRLTLNDLLPFEWLDLGKRACRKGRALNAEKAFMAHLNRLRVQGYRPSREFQQEARTWFLDGAAIQLDRLTTPA